MTATIGREFYLSYSLWLLGAYQWHMLKGGMELIYLIAKREKSVVF